MLVSLLSKRFVNDQKLEVACKSKQWGKIQEKDQANSTILLTPTLTIVEMMSFVGCPPLGLVKDKAGSIILVKIIPYFIGKIHGMDLIHLLNLARLKHMIKSKLLNKN